MPGQIMSNSSPPPYSTSPRRTSVQRLAGRAARGSSTARRVNSVTPTPATRTNVAAKRVDSGPVHGSKNALDRRRRRGCRGAAAGSRGSSSRRRRSGRRRARRRARAAAGVAADGRPATACRSPSSPAHLVGGTSRSAAAARRRRRPCRGAGSPAGTNTIDVCMCGGSSSASRRRAKWNGLRPSSSGCTPWAVPAPIITRRAVAGHGALAVAGVLAGAHRCGRRGRRRRGAARPCRRATARCRRGSGSGAPARRRAGRGTPAGTGG